MGDTGMPQPMSEAPLDETAGLDAVEVDGAESDLAAAAARGNDDAFARLLAPYRSPLFGYLVRLVGSRNAAEELLQETLIRCWRGLPAYRDRGRFAAWLFAIARNAARDAWRQRERRRVVFSTRSIDDQPEPSTGPDALAAIEARELQARVAAILQTLPPERREVFLLRQHGGLLFREIADLLERPLGTVLSHMHRAVEAIREGLTDHAE